MIDPGFVYLTMLIVIGYGVTRDDLTVFQKRIAFFAAITKFLIGLINDRLTKYHKMIPTVITFEIGLLIMVMLITIGYAVHNLKSVNIFLRTMEKPE